jgi:hypothetical protein
VRNNEVSEEYESEESENEESYEEESGSNSLSRMD